ncbi:hypothetical protein [Nitrosomonas communis]|uniref:Trypsin-like peptidase domain-containing protein n=1 Tax=Nitrosomonas communis TaxID=44574 RepID=A0A1H2XUS3_9PROT|nr:hypothetical protein [Nitrosomonas communis]SDW96560.1 hypothetical protein SAMN05421882_10437 [Nitrosomonas communis]
MIITVSDHIHLCMREVEDILNSFTYPVFINAKNERPDLIASSVVISLDSRNFLITASHVLDQIENANSPFYIAKKSNFVALIGEFIRSISKDKDHFDIAFLELNNEFVDKNAINVLSESSLMINRHFNRPTTSIAYSRLSMLKE